MTSLTPQLEHTYVRRGGTDTSKRIEHSRLKYSHDGHTTLASVLDINTVDCDDQHTDAAGQAEQNHCCEAHWNDVWCSCHSVKQHKDKITVWSN